MKRKKCSVCKHTKTLKHFYRDGWRILGVRSECKKCNAKLRGEIA